MSRKTHTVLSVNYIKSLTKNSGWRKTPPEFLVMRFLAWLNDGSLGVGWAEFVQFFRLKPDLDLLASFLNIA